jgi:hypothetical protein
MFQWKLGMKFKIQFQHLAIIIMSLNVNECKNALGLVSNVGNILNLWWILSLLICYITDNFVKTNIFILCVTWTLCL